MNKTPIGGVLRVGLTGGSATGKSTVAAIFAELGATIIDADAIAGRLLQTGTDAYRETVERFGESILMPDGRIDRARLALLIFSDPERRKTLEAILHPRIHEEEERQVERLAKRPGLQIVVTDAALLVETGAYRRYDRLVVTSCREKTQLRRLTEDRRLDPDEAMQRIRSQLPSHAKVRVADHHLDTDRPLEETRRAVQRLYSEMKKMAGR